MIWKLSALTPTWREGLQKGNGGAWCFYPPAGELKSPGSRVRMMGRLALDPGASIGPHMHTENEEVYIILSGSGRYLDGGEYHDVGPGDVTLTSPEGPHALENTGTEPLVFVALVAEKES